MEEKKLIELIHNNAMFAKIERARNGNSTILNNIRQEVFIPKQKISVIRKWLAMLFDIQLTKDELDIIKKIAVKPKVTYSDIVFKIIVNQNHLTEVQVEEWFSYINSSDKDKISFDLIKSGQLNEKHKSFQIKIFSDLLLNKSYTYLVISELDLSLSLGNTYIWETYFYIVIDFINKKNDLSKHILFYWKKTFYLDQFAKLKNIQSIILYEETKKEQYLPQIAIDTFLF